MLILIYDYIFYTPVLRLHCLNCSKRKSDVWLFKHRRRTKSAKQFCSMQSIRKQSHLYSPNVHHKAPHYVCEYVCVYVCESLKLCKCSQVENIKVITYSLCLCVAPLYSLVFTCLKIL